MEWYPKDVTAYRLDTRHLTTLEHGAYNLLIDEYMLTRQPLPDDDRALASIAKMPLVEWSQIAPTIRAFFRARAGLLTLKRCDAILNAQDNSSKRLSQNAKKAAEKRWSTVKDLDASRMPDACVEHAPAMLGDARGRLESKKDAVSTASSREAAADTKALARKAADISTELKTICGTDENRHPAWAVISPIVGWLQAGADPDLDILPATRAVMARRNGKGPPSSPGYLTQPVLDAMQSRLAGSTSTTPSAVREPDDPIREAAAVANLKALDRWVEGGRKGPMPTIEDHMPKPNGDAR